MKVLYYTSISFLDIAIEVIKIIKNDVDLHVLIEISPNSLQGNIVNIHKLPKFQTFINPSELLNKEDYAYLEPYINGCASINFIVNTNKRNLVFSSIKLFVDTWKYIRKIDPDIIQMEEISLRRVILLPFIYFIKKFFVIIHDSTPHSGENIWKARLPRYLFFKLPISKNYIFYSKFSKNQFEQNRNKDKRPKLALRMYPYSFYKNYKKNISEKKHILFFGRLSIYKGINVFIKSIPLVIKDFPSELFVIAGRSIPGYSFDENLCREHKSQISILNRYIPNEELVTLIQESKFVVCPYLDASQSGVLMTALALNTPVIATNVGAFSEYIEDNINGLLIPANDATKLAEAINSALNGNFYLAMEENIRVKNDAEFWSSNKTTLLNAYFS